MSTNIAIVTTSGRAYFRLVSEFKRRRLRFLSLIPEDWIPLYIRLAITTESERDNIHCSKILTYDESKDPSKIVDEAIQLLRGKIRYRNIIIGIDPGKKFGLALLGDNTILKTLELISMEETVKEIIRILKKTKANKKTVKIGNGVREYQIRLYKQLDKMLPHNISLESVEEEGTTKNIKKLFGKKKGSIDALSAVRISMRGGKRIARKV